MKPINLWIHPLIALLMTLLLKVFLSYPSPLPFFCSMTLSFAFYYGLAYNGYHPLRLAGTSLLLAFFASLIFLYPNVGNDYQSVYVVGYRPPEDWLLIFPAVFYISHCFHAAMHEKSDFKISYSDLFYASWNSVAVLLVSVFFCFIINVLLFFFFIVLRLGGIRGTILIVEKQIFIFPALLLIGIGIIKQYPALMDQIRLLVLKIVRFIFPYIILLSALVLSIYSFTSEKGDAASLIPWLFTFYGLGLLCFNAVFQDGKKMPVYPSVQYILVTIHLLIQTCLAIILGVSCLHYVFYEKNAGLLLSLLICFGAGYGISVFFREDKQGLIIKSTNVIVAIYAAIAAVIANSPFYTSSKQPYNNDLSNRYYYESGYPDKSKTMALTNAEKKIIEFVPEQRVSDNPKDYLRVFYACKVTLGNRDYTGNIIGDYSNIAYGNEEKPLRSFQVLGKN